MHLSAGEVDGRPESRVVPDERIPASTDQPAAAQLAAVEASREHATQHGVRQHVEPRPLTVAVCCP